MSRFSRLPYVENAVYALPVVPYANLAPHKVTSGKTAIRRSNGTKEGQGAENAPVWSLCAREANPFRMYHDDKTDSSKIDPRKKMTP